MAALTTAQRKRLPASAFAGPDRSFPVNDPNHARNALARSAQLRKRGLMSIAAESRIDAKARKVLHK